MKKLTCIVCPNGCGLTAVEAGDGWEITGNTCPKGRDFAIAELTDPRRTVCSTVRTAFAQAPRLSVRTDGEVKKALIFDVMRAINAVTLDSPVHTGDVVIEDICGSGVNLIATTDLYELLKEDEYCGR
jgi:CxxC motif-containing protein